MIGLVLSIVLCLGAIVLVLWEIMRAPLVPPGVGGEE
jgi:hypothetical protein